MIYTISNGLYYFQRKRRKQMVRVNLEIVLPAIGINGARGKFGSAFAARVVNVFGE